MSVPVGSVVCYLLRYPNVCTGWYCGMLPVKISQCLYRLVLWYVTTSSPHITGSTVTVSSSLNLRLHMMEPVFGCRAARMFFLVITTIARESAIRCSTSPTYCWCLSGVKVQICTLQSRSRYWTSDINYFLTVEDSGYVFYFKIQDFKIDNSIN